MMKRPVEHVQQFVLAEFGTEGAIAGTATARAEGQGQDGQLVLKGRYQPKHCESLLRKCLCLRSKDVLFFDLMLFLDASCVIFLPEMTLQTWSLSDAKVHQGVCDLRDVQIRTNYS